MLPAITKFAVLTFLEHPYLCITVLVLLLILGPALYLLFRAASPNSDNRIHTHFPHVAGASSQKPIRVVVVFGWLGAKRQYLRRLLEAYDQELKVNTLSYISPPLYFINSTDHRHVPEWTAMCEALLRLRNAHPDAPLDIFIHLHSNNGVISLTKFYGALSSERYSGLLSSLRAVFFDCAPYLPPYARLDERGEAPKPPRGWMLLVVLVVYTWRSTGAAMIAMRGRSFHWLFSPMSFFSSLALVLWNVLLCGRRPPHEMFTVMRSIFRAQPLPLLCVYSHADALIPANLVRQWIEECRRNGQEVTDMEVQDAKHVDIFRHHKEEYLAKVRHMLDTYGSK